MGYSQKIFLPISVMLFFTDAATGQDAIQACHSMKIASERLSCYDRVTDFDKKPAENSPAPNQSTGDQWSVKQEKSNLDNRSDVWVSVPSTNLQPNQIGISEHARLWVRCMNNRTNLFVSFNDYTPDNQSVRYKLDDGSVQKAWMVHMQGGKGIGLWSGGDAIPFVRKLFDKNTFILGYKSYSNLNLEFTFDISGLRSVIEPLSTSCQWKP